MHKLDILSVKLGSKG